MQGTASSIRDTGPAEMGMSDSDFAIEWSSGVAKPPGLGEWERRIIDEFLKYMAAQNRDALLAAPEDVVNFVSRMNDVEHDYSRRVLVRFFDVAMRLGRRPSNPAGLIKNRKAISIAPLELSVDETKQFLDYLRQQALVYGRLPQQVMSTTRTWAMYELIYSAGLTTRDLPKLKACDIHRYPPSIVYPGTKNGRRVPITDSAYRAVHLMQFLSFAYYEEKGEWLFHSGRSPHKPVSYSVLNHGAVESLKSAPPGISKDITPEAVRYSLARHLFVAGMSKRDIAYIFGYEKIRYVERAFPDVYRRA